MFNSLDEMERKDQCVAPTREQWLRRGVVVLITMVLFGVLYAGVQFFE